MSNLGGEDAVGSVVTFLDGRPFKSGYRRFRIRTVAGIDDYAMIAEVVERRFRRLTEEETPFPDVLLIDGGKGHLHAALQALKAVRVRPPCVLAIAKREEIVYRGEPPVELRLKRQSAGPARAPIRPRRSPPLQRPLPPHPARQETQAQI